MFRDAASSLHVPSGPMSNTKTSFFCHIGLDDIRRNGEIQSRLQYCNMVFMGYFNIKVALEGHNSLKSGKVGLGNMFSGLTFYHEAIFC